MIESAVRHSLHGIGIEVLGNGKQHVAKTLF